MIKLIKQILKKNYIPLNSIEISSKILATNLNTIKKTAKPLKIAPVLKGNAYGHGIVQVAKVLQKENIPMLCVDSIYEAYELYKASIKTKILIMGYIDPQNLKVKSLPFSYAVYDIDQIEAINKFQKNANVHIKVDTGMHRIGVPIKQLRSFIKQAKKFENIKIEGLMSHLAHGEDIKSELTKKQIKNFKLAKKILEEEGIRPQWFHLFATSALSKISKKEAVKISNMVRVGKSLYGIGTDGSQNVKPVLSLTTKIVQIKLVKKGERVGYQGTFKAQKDTKIAVLPIGFSDGLDRRLSNKAGVLIGGKKCKIIGLISMNITTIDLKNAKDAKVGDKVVIISKNAKDENSIEGLGKVADTLPSELLVRLSPTSIRRNVV